MFSHNTTISYKMCFHKKVIKTADYAEKLAKEYSIRFNKNMTYYFCPICQNFHITSK